MLTLAEYAILCLLARNAGKVVTQDELVTEVWGEERLGSGGILEAAINPRRKKIEDAPSNPKYIVTRPNVGYVFNKTAWKFRY